MLLRAPKYPSNRTPRDAESQGYLFAVEAMESRILLSGAPLDVAVAVNVVPPVTIVDGPNDLTVTQEAASKSQLAAKSDAPSAATLQVSFGDTMALPSAEDSASAQGAQATNADPAAANTSVETAISSTPGSQLAASQTTSSDNLVSSTGIPTVTNDKVSELVTTLRAANGPPGQSIVNQSVPSISSNINDASGLLLGVQGYTSLLSSQSFGGGEALGNSLPTGFFNYQGYEAQLTAPNELTVYATGSISLANLQPDALYSEGLRKLVIQGSDSTNDTLIADLSQGGTPLAITFNGGVGAYDSLEVSGVNGGSYTPGKVFGDGVFSSGVTNITFTGLEPVIVDGTSDPTGTFTFKTPSTGGGNDVITIDSPIAGWNRISGTSGGVAFENLTFRNIPNFVLDTGSNDQVGSNADVITFQSWLVATGLQSFHLQTGSGNDTVVLNHSHPIGRAE